MEVEDMLNKHLFAKNAIIAPKIDKDNVTSEENSIEYTKGRSIKDSKESDQNQSVGDTPKLPLINLDSVIGFDALYDSAMKCKRLVSWKDNVAHYYHCCPEETYLLSSSLQAGSYKERPALFFTVYEPKEREIMSIAFRDRVYQRSLNDNALYPIVSKRLIYDNVACQKGKGTQMGRERLKCHLQKFYRKHGLNGYVLQCDVRKYYPSMDHDKVKESLHSMVTDPDIYDLTAKILDTFPTEKGFNPGSQTIQIVGISFLDQLDHYIKEQLRVKQYIRYMDDMVLLADSEEQALQWREEIRQHLADLGLELNSKKTKIYKISKSIRFLGFDFHLTKTGKVLMFLAPENVKKRRKKLQRMANKVLKGEMSARKLYESYGAWRAHAALGDSTKLLIEMDKFVKGLLPPIEKPEDPNKIIVPKFQAPELLPPPPPDDDSCPWD